METLKHWHETLLGLLIFALIELGIAYGIASLAINNGNLWYYLIALIFLFGTLRNLFNLFAKLIRHA